MHSSSKHRESYNFQIFIQCNNSTSALFLTAAAQNLLCIKLAESIDVKIEQRWITWLKASCFPGLVSLLTTPIILYKIYPPHLKSTPEAPTMAKEKLQHMGPMKRNEWIMIGTLLLTVALWISRYVTCQSRFSILACHMIIVTLTVFNQCEFDKFKFKMS